MIFNNERVAELDANNRMKVSRVLASPLNGPCGSSVRGNTVRSPTSLQLHAGNQPRLAHSFPNKHNKINNTKTKAKHMSQDPLSTDLMTLDTSFPVLAPGAYSIKLDDSELMTNEAGTLKQTYTTTEPSTSVDGQPMKAGTKVFHTINTVPTGKSTPDIVAKSCGSMLQAQSVVIHSVNELRERHKELQGQVFSVILNAQPAGNDSKGVYRDARNNIVKFIKRS